MSGGFENGGATQPLHGLVVVDLTTWVAGPNCTKLLADFGARVIKVEPPGGDPARGMGPFRGDVPDREQSGLFLHLNTNKESVVVDASTIEGANIVRELAGGADVVVESYRPGTLASWGLALHDLIAERRDLVVTSITPFGQYGPYASWDATDIVAYAMGGMSGSGRTDREPVKLVGNAVLMQSGATACVATLGALFHAQLRREGQHVDVATFETQNGSVDRRRYYLLSYQYSGTVAERATFVGAGRPSAGGRFECADGKEVTTGRIWPDHIGRAAKVLGDAALSALVESDPLTAMSEHADLVNEVIARWAAARPARVAMREAQAAGWPVVVVNDPLLLLDDDHLRARGFWVTAHHPVAGDVVHTGPPWRIDGGGWAIRRAAPTLGQDTSRVLSELCGLSERDIASLVARGVVA